MLFLAGIFKFTPSAPERESTVALTERLKTMLMGVCEVPRADASDGTRTWPFSVNWAFCYWGTVAWCSEWEWKPNTLLILYALSTTPP